jgi:hypothetical protein
MPFSLSTFVEYHRARNAGLGIWQLADESPSSRTLVRSGEGYSREVRSCASGLIRAGEE